jgi:hypothetical protein
MANKHPMSEETKRKISQSMRKIFEHPCVSIDTKKNIVLGFIAEFMRDINKVESNLN